MRVLLLLVMMITWSFGYLACNRAETASYSQIPEAVTRLHLADGECQQFAEEKHLQEASILHHVGHLDKSLVILPCHHGAYNLAAFVYLYDSREPENASREVFVGVDIDDGGLYPESLLFFPEYDPETGILSAYYAGVGSGGCGVESFWVRDSRWTLLEHRIWFDCEQPRSPEDWTVMYKHPTRSIGVQFEHSPRVF